MNIPEDPFKHLRAITDPLKSISDQLNRFPTDSLHSRHIESITGSAYMRAMETVQNDVLRSRLYTSEVERIQEYLQGGNAASRAFEQASQLLAKNSFESIQASAAASIGMTLFDSRSAELVRAANKVAELGYLGLQERSPFLALDSYHRATSWLEPLRDFQAQGAQAALEKYKMLAAAADPMRIYKDALEALGESRFHTIENSHLSGILDSLSRMAADISSESFDDEEIELDPDDVAEYRNLAGIGSNGTFLSRADIEELITHFITSYHQLTGARDRKIFATYVYPFLLAVVFSYINPYNDFLIKQKLEAGNRTTEKAVQVAARESGAPAHVLGSFRFVSAQSVHVRVNGRIKSPTIGTLKFGQPVEVLKKDGGWTLIHYSDSASEVSLQGWVLSRYLKKFQ